MRGLFIHDHKFPKGNGSYYYSYGFDKEFFSRYLSIFDELEVIGRQVEARDATKKDSNITYLTKLIVKKANYVIYVTEEFLERRYPTKGNYIACSNVTLNSVNDADINNRLEMIDKIDLNNKLIFGTCATIDVVYKGQEDVMKVIHKLVKEGYNIEYQLVGGGNKKYLESVARKLGISNRVKFIGTLEHKDVFRWLE